MKLKINEVEYRLVWGLVAINKFCEAVGHTDDMEAAFNLAFPAVGSDVKILAQWNARKELVYAALQSGAELDRQDFDLTKNELQHYIDTADQGEADKIWEDFMDSQIHSTSIRNILFQSVEEEDAPKKKSRQVS